MGVHAALLREDGAFDVVPLPALKVDDGKVLVRTVIAAICGSDLHVVDRGWGNRTRPARPGSPGHESVVTVCNDPSGHLRSGDLALAVPPAVESAAFATHQLVAAQSLIPLEPDEVAERMIFAQQLGTVLHGFDVFRSDSLTGETVAVVGAGSVGVMFAHEARQRGATHVVVSDPHPSRRMLAEAVGATLVTGSGELSEAVRDLTDGAGATLVIEASGTDQGRNEAIDALAPGGTLGMFGLPERIGPSPIDVGTLFLRKGRIASTHDAQRRPGLPTFREALTRLRDGVLDVGLFRTEVFALEGINRAFECAREQGDVHKVLIRFDES